MSKNQIQYIVDLVKMSENRVPVILMTSTHHFTDVAICNTGYEFYNLDIPQFPIKWSPNVPVPTNMHIIKDIQELPHKPDLIISQNIVDQYNIFKQLSYYFDCPLIEFEHTFPTKEWTRLKTVDTIAKQVQVDKYVFISNISKDAWAHKDDPKAAVVYHMVDSNEFCGWDGGKGQRRAMILVNQFNTRQWAVGNPTNLMLKDNRIDLFGMNPGFNSTPLSQTQVIDTMRKYDLFINQSEMSPLPASVLEAAAIGMPILSRKTCAIPEFFEHGKSILFYETDDEALSIINDLFSKYDVEYLKQLGNNAREVILKDFNKERYTSDWQKIITETIANYE